VWKINQVGEFSKDHRVITFDYRGTGQSSKPSVDYTTKMFCDDLVGLMDRLKAEDASSSAIPWAAESHSSSRSIIQTRFTSWCSLPPARIIR
jgi:pimeloyl-ACP methyl ester carboxylesterase